MTFSIKPKFHQTAMSQEIYQHLRKTICSSNAFKPGERINVDQISQEWQVSKTPVREALKALEQDGVVKYIPRRGFFVTALDPAELSDILSIRIALEVHALERGFARIDRNEMRRMSDLFQQTFAVLQTERDAARYLEVDAQFHSLIIHASDNRKMIEVYENMQGAMRYLRYRDTFATEAAMGNSMPEHMAVIEAILQDDCPKAMLALKTHLQNVEARLFEINHARAQSTY